MGSLVTMHLIVKIFKQISYCNFHSVIILPCYPGYTVSTILVRFVFTILSSPGRAVCVPGVTCRCCERHMTNNTTFKIVNISMLFVNETYCPGIYRDIIKMVGNKQRGGFWERSVSDLSEVLSQN